MSKQYAIGIDLGTTKCSVSVFAEGRIKTLPIDNGKTVLPSYVYFGEDTVDVGIRAKQKLSRDPKHVVYNSKRLLGKLYADKGVQEDIRTFPFSVEEGSSGDIVISIDKQEGVEQYSPIEISAFLISQAVRCASEELQATISEAVITVPAYFNNTQRNDTINAGIIAGLDQVHLFSEPTAAIIAYNLVNPGRKEMVLVVDIGGGSFDCSIVQVSNKNYAVMSCLGNAHLGGEDITNNLLEVVARSYNELTKKNLQHNVEDRVMLREAVEEAKINLSTVDSYDIDVEDSEGEEFHYTLTRHELEVANKSVFDECFAKIARTIENGYLQTSDITKVLLVGGVSNTPYIKDHVIAMFGKEKVYSNLTGTETVSQGAAVIAGISRDLVEKGFDFQVNMFTTVHNVGNDDFEKEKLNVCDMTPMHLGIRTSDGKLSPIIPATSSIPCKMAKQYQAHRDYQKTLRFKIYQGSEKIADRCELISEILITIDNPGPARDTVIEVTFSLDDNSTLYVEAMELHTMKKVEKKVDTGALALSRERVMNMRSTVLNLTQSSYAKNRLDLVKKEFATNYNKLRMHLNSLKEDETVLAKKKLLEGYANYTKKEGLTEEEIKKTSDYLHNEVYYE